MYLTARKEDRDQYKDLTGEEWGDGLYCAYRGHEKHSGPEEPGH